MPAMLVITLTSILQSGVLIAIATYIGLQATQIIGLHLPVLEAFLADEPIQPFLLSGLATTLLSGIGAGLMIMGLEKYYFQPRLPEAFHNIKTKQALWKRWLACFYGAIYEELLLRLFIMSGLIWLITRVWPAQPGQINLAIFWSANIMAALLFGLGHLPATARIARLTPLIITRALILNGLAGLLFGALFFHFGLEFAMIAHFCMDFMIHVILPEMMATDGKPMRGKE